MYEDQGLLSNQGYSYETVSPFLLEPPTAKIEDGRLDRDGVGYKCQIIPEQQAVSYPFLLKVKEMLEHCFPFFGLERNHNMPCTLRIGRINLSGKNGFF
ncbi:hypothetical protein [Paenibacillus segetis]|uniref:hypothetical protein n=1 Tax=Paenibacillus segetis TaxID=1325360 RepID=UPI001886B0FA|nr:hypothetical protein [Paenibacillus segetis]